MKRALLVVLPLALGCGEEIVYQTDDPWGDQVDWPGIGAGKIMVTNSGDDSVSFLDPVTLEPVFHAPVGRVPAEREGPHHGAASPDGAFYYVGLSNFVPGSGSGPHGSHGTGDVDGYLLKYDSATHRMVGELRVDRSPGDVRITPDGRYVLQSHFDLVSILEALNEGEDPRLVLSTLAVTDAETMAEVARIPVCPAGHGIGVSGDGGEAYVACWGSDELAVVSLAEPITDDAAVERYLIGEGGNPSMPAFGPYAVAVSPATGEVWVSNLEGGTVVPWDPESRELDFTREVAAGGNPLFGDFTDDGAALYVAHQGSETLVRIDPATGDFETYGFPEDACQKPHAVLLLEGDTTAAVACEGDHAAPGTVVRLRLDIPGGVAAHEADFEVGVYPDDLIMIPGR